MADMRLIITSQGHPTQEKRISTSASIGRSADNTICINDPSVARYHAMIELRANGFCLTDLGSTNGTTVNGKPLAADHQLQSGDVFTLGAATTIQVAEISAQNANAAPAQAFATPAPTANHSTTAGSAGSTTAGLSTMHLLMAGFTVLIIIGTVAAALIVLKTKKTDEPALSRNFDPVATATPKPTVAKKIEDDEPPPPRTTNVSGDGTEQLVRLLATSISGKSNYVFDPKMSARIAAKTSEYSVDVSDEARKYRLEIARAFTNAKGMKPVLGYVLAMSQSKFGRTNSGGVGMWQVPAAEAKNYLQPGEDLAALAQPKRAADIAASYLNEILTKFESQDFMYALACYGMPISQAGEIRAKLQAVDPAERRDFWKMVERGIIPPEGADRVVRFFAAGIVGENPNVFGLSGTPFSEL